MKQIIISVQVVLFLFVSGMSLQAQQTWNPKNTGDAFLHKVEQALDLTQSQMDFAKTALSNARTYTRAEFKNMSSSAKTSARTNTRNTFFDQLNSVLTASQKTKLVEVRSKFS